MSSFENEGVTHKLPGLEPDNLLAFIALLGLLRALETAAPQWRPHIAWRGEPPVAALHLASVVAQRDIVVEADRGIRNLGRHYTFPSDDLKFSPQEFRSFAKQALNYCDKSVLVAALASDAVVKRGDTNKGSSEVEPTPFCAMFGQGHQQFLARLTRMAQYDEQDGVEALSRALFDAWRYEDRSESFRWDPGEDRRYAYQFGDPSESRNKTGTVFGANRLAAIGFAVLTSAPATSGLQTLGIARQKDQDVCVCWPLVAVPTSLSGHLALLAHPWLVDPLKAPRLATYGVRAVARAHRFRVEYYFNFERATVQFF